VPRKPSDPDVLHSGGRFVGLGIRKLDLRTAFVDGPKLMGPAENGLQRALESQRKLKAQIRKPKATSCSHTLRTQLTKGKTY